MKLSPEQIGLVMFECGFLGPMYKGGDRDKQLSQFLDVAIAVCLAESGGSTTSKNSHSSATGLWQIMVSVHGDKIKQASDYWWAEDGWPGKNITAPKGYRKPDIFDPRVNTTVAQQIYSQAGGWSPWEAYNTGAYKRYLGHGAKAYATWKDPERQKQLLAALNQEIKSGQELFTTGANILTALNPTQNLDKFDWGSALGDIKTFIRDAGVAIGVFVLAIVLVLAGLWLLIKDTTVGKTAKKVASVTPVGRATSLVK